MKRIEEVNLVTPAIREVHDDFHCASTKYLRVSAGSGDGGAQVFVVLEEKPVVAHVRSASTVNDPVIRGTDRCSIPARCNEHHVAARVPRVDLVERRRNVRRDKVELANRGELQVHG